MRHFQLNIETFNEAMETRADVAEALHRVAQQIEVGGFGPNELNKIRDLNGNDVGYFVWRG